MFAALEPYCFNELKNPSLSYSYSNLAKNGFSGVIMPVHERRQHFRIDDHVYFEYKIMEPGHCYSDESIAEELLGKSGQRYIETMAYFESLDFELAELTLSVAQKEPSIVHYLNLINAKIDYLLRSLTIGEKAHLKKVNLSLGGMSFNSAEKISEKTHLSLVIYTKPKLIPIIVNAVVIYSQFTGETMHRTAIQFEGLTQEQEQLLSRHIMLKQRPCRLD